ncbi:hypothetical protein ACFSCX_23490 [Bacillus salitolerans]|uniref:Integrase n=1 Tax=Bacillus salitolerans TaxID=1437434 RepID=A0ABW4LXB8_9BACI
MVVFYSHKINRKGLKYRAIIKITTDYSLVTVSYDLGLYDSEDEATRAIVMAKQKHAEDITDSNQEKSNLHLENFIKEMVNRKN